MFGHTNAFFNDIGAEFLNRKSAYVACELADNTIAEPVVVEVQDVLYDIVSVGVLNQSEGVVRDFIHKLDTLMIRCMVDTSLQYTTSVAVGGDFDTISGNRIIDKLVVFRCELVEIGRAHV